jgi:hypothetical protein
LRVLLLVVVATAASTGAARGQTAADARLAEIFDGIGPSAPLQVVTPSFFVEDAFVEEVGDRSVALSQNGTTVDVPYVDIRGVSTRDNHWLQGTLWGTAAGALIGGVSGLMYASFTCSTPEVCQDNERKGTIRGAILLGAAGGIGGFVIGRHSFYWRPIFP